MSESDYELVRVEIEAIKDLSIGMGILARVHKGTVASFERRKVNNEAWLPAKVTWTASGRVLLVRRLRLRGISEFSAYRKFSVDTDWKISGASLISRSCTAGRAPAAGGLAAAVAVAGAGKLVAVTLELRVSIVQGVRSKS